LAAKGLLDAALDSAASQSKRLARAKEQGFNFDNVMYHASKQDIDEFVPGYDDGLSFLTPNKEFANNWLGKGKFQERQGGTGAIEGVRAEKKRFGEEADKILKSLPEDQRSQYFAEILLPQRQQLIRDEQLADSAIYPVVTRAKKPFVPHKDYEVLEELLGEEKMNEGFEVGGSFIMGMPTYGDALKSGNYLLYEKPEVVEFLKSKGYDSMFLKESTDIREELESTDYSTFAVFDPKNIRSVNAQFDPKNKDSSKILASAAPIAVGAGLLGLSGESEAGPLKFLREGENLTQATERARLAWANSSDDKVAKAEYLELRRARDEQGDLAGNLLSEPDVSYRGSHQPSGPDNEYPVRLDDLTKTISGESGGYPTDFYSSDGPRLYAPGPRFSDDEYGLANKQSYIAALKARGNPDAEVTMYRAVPNDKNITGINPGDFVTLSPKYAEIHAYSGYGPSGNDSGKVISEKVKVKDIYFAGDDVNEYGYFPDNKPNKEGGFATPLSIASTAGAGLLGNAAVQRFNEGVLGGADFLANAGSAVAEPFITAAQTLRALPTNTPTSEIEAQRAAYQNSLDYQPRTEIGRNATESALGLLGGALQGPMAAGKAIAEPLIPIYDAAAEQYKRLPRRVQLGVQSLLDTF